MQHDSCKDDILKRLKRIEGQVKGIYKMVEQDKCCSDILVQVAAIRAAINKVGGLILENYSRNCIKDAVKKKDEEETINELIDIVLKFIR
ncbi:MAG: metal-sensitive transcriptional regulator [Clostridiaceae bacterium]|nr:metal-sensitive transcriptional regulator [Clostridiaceae bacterium]